LQNLAHQDYVVEEFMITLYSGRSLCRAAVSNAARRTIATNRQSKIRAAERRPSAVTWVVIAARETPP
jgi:hypothetical protein